MADINPRDIDRSCIPASIRGTYATEALALADSPTYGDLVVIGGNVYAYNGITFEPYGFQEDVLIPEEAFAVTGTPTTAEVQTYVDANYSSAPNGSRFYYPSTGDALTPDYVYEVDANGVITRIETAGVSKNPVAVLDVIDQNNEDAEFYGGSSFAKPNGCAIANYSWTVTNLTSGSVIGSFNGAGGLDASGETLVDNGTYDQFYLAKIPDLCGDITVALVVTDCNGLVSETVTFTIFDYGLASMEFISDGSVLNATIATNDGSTPLWDFGDGTTATGNTVSHSFAAGAPPYTVSVLACKSAVTQIVIANSGASGGLSSLFDDDPVGFTSLTVLDLENSGFSGNVPDHTAWSGLTTFNLHNNPVGGFVGGNLQSTITVFDLHGASVSGLVPDPTAATGLTVYDIADNGFFGTIHDFSALTSLTVWDVSGTSVDGTLPAGITGLTDLVILSGSNTLLTGTLPAVAGLTSLTNIEFNSTNMSGTLPTLTSLTSLVVFDVGQNAFTGNAPSVSGLAALTDYLIDNNSLDYVTGSISGNPVLLNIQAHNNALSAAQTDDILCDTSGEGSFGGFLNVGGTNVSPTAIGTACAGTLAGNFWTVIT